MPLNKQVINIPFSGLQTKVDPKVAPLGTYAVLDNFIMNRWPELVKRNGLQVIGASTTPSNINASYNYINEIGVITNNALYSYSPSLDEYQLKGQTASPIVSSDTVIANTYIQTNCDGFTASNDIMGSVWEDSRGGVRCSIKDLVSDTYLVSDMLLLSTGVKPKVIAYKESIYFFAIDPGTTTLYIQRYDSLNNSFDSPHAISSAMASCFTYDVIVASSNLLIATVQTNTSPDVVWAYFWDVTNQVVGSVSHGLPIPASLEFVNSGTLPPAISLAADTGNNYFTCTLYNDSHQVYTKSFEPYIAPATSELLVLTSTDPGWALSTCVDSKNNTYIFASSFNTLHNSFQGLVSNNFTTPTLVYGRAFYLQLGVVSKSFFYSGNAYVTLGYDSELQNTYFGVRDDGACFARMFSTQAGGNIKKANCVSSFSLVENQPNTYILPLLKTTKIVSTANSYNSTTSVYTEQIYFTPQTIDNKVLGQYLNIAGGYLKQYDGSPTVFEQGFHLYPEQPVLTPSAGGGIANGSYAYLVCWEWTDNQGQLHRSEPSVPINITTTGSNGTVTVTVRTLTITNKETRFANARTPVVMAVYRTLTLGTTYYRVNQLTTNFVYNDSTVQTINYVDTTSDTDLQSHAQLYTTGGVFQNISTPACNLMTVGKNTVFLAGLDTEPNRVFFSKQKELGVGVEFSNEQSFIVDSLGGNITALAAMDDKILIFKKSLVYYIAGVLPDKLGNGAAPYPLLVASDCGCNSPQSIVLTGLGIMFESQKGIYLIDRQLNVSYIGQALDNITTKRPAFKVSSATNLPDQNQVFMTDVSGQVLVYDTYFSQWYTHTLPFVPVSSTILNNSWYVSSATQVYESIPGLATDGNGISIQSKIKTNWISLTELEGFSRIYAIMILGDNANLDHRLRVNLYYDFEEFPRESLSIVPNSLSGADYGAETPFGGLPVGGTAIPYGNSGEYGASTYGGAPFGGTGTPYGGYFDGTYQFMIRPRMQKCTSIMIEIFDEFPDGFKTTSFTFSGLSLVAGMKNGWNKNLSYTKRLT